MVSALRGLLGGISCSLTSDAIDVVRVSIDSVLSALAAFTSLKKLSVVGSLAVIGVDVVLASWGEGASCWGRSANLGDMSSWLNVPEEAWSSVPESKAIWRTTFSMPELASGIL